MPLTEASKAKAASELEAGRLSSIRDVLRAYSSAGGAVSSTGAANGGIRRVTGGGDLGGILEGEEIVRVPDPDVGLGVTLDFTVSFSFSLPFSNGKVVWRTGFWGCCLGCCFC